MFNFLFVAPVQLEAKQSDEVVSLLGEAVKFLQANRPDEAEPRIRRALVLSPRNADAHNLLGTILDRRGQVREAEREYREALRLNPQSVSALANLGILLAHTSRPEQAITAFTAVLQAVPNHPQATFNLAIALYSLKRFDEAASRFAAASALTPNAAEPFYYLGLIASLRGQSSEAIGDWQRALQIRANFPEANFAIGEELLKNHRLEDAEPFYERALVQDPTKFVYYARFGGVSLRLDRYEKALEIFQRRRRLSENCRGLLFPRHSGTSQCHL